MLDRAIQWIHGHHINGQAIQITDKKKGPYPEVTGYYIPTLLAIGEVAMAEGFARWLVSIQKPDGSFSLDANGASFVFDTGQVIRGWVSIIDRLPELAAPLKRACDWIIAGADPQTGRLQVPKPGGAWLLGPRGEVSEGIHLYVLQPMRDAAKALNLPYIRAAADKALAYYLAHVNATDFAQRPMLSHFYGYMQEAFVELGCLDEARRGMASIERYQLDNGAVPGYFDVPWVCSTGLSQLAKVWYMLGDLTRADRAMSFVTQLQNASGGWYGGYGVGADYFPGDEISWAVKYWIDAEQLRIARHFDVTAHQYSTTISAADGRVQAILQALPGARRVLDAGCGKGRYAALLQQQDPALEIHAVDVSPEMLRHVPAGIHTRESSIQVLPYPNGYFDLVYCVEALEHAPKPEAALTEMARVLAPGGRLVVIDKNKARQGALRIESWERWFDVNELLAQMAAAGVPGQARFVSHNQQPADGLFVAWTGVKTTVTASVNFYRDVYFDETNRALVDACRRGDRAWIADHLAAQDEQHPELHFDERFENRVGMQLIAQLIAKADSAFDVVDVACGNAQLLRKLRDAGHRIRGVDASSVRVAHNPDVPMQQGFGEALPLESESADIVVSQEAMEHVFDLDQALRECQRVLRPGGLFFCQVPLGKFADGSNHVRIFSPESLQRAAQGVGMELVKTWVISYLVGEAPNNIFLVARRPGAGTAATDRLAGICRAL